MEKSKLKKKNENINYAFYITYKIEIRDLIDEFCDSLQSPQTNQLEKKKKKRKPVHDKTAILEN